MRFFRKGLPLLRQSVSIASIVSVLTTATTVAALSIVLGMNEGFHAQVFKDVGKTGPVIVRVYRQFGEGEPSPCQLSAEDLAALSEINGIVASAAETSEYLYLAPKERFRIVVLGVTRNYLAVRRVELSEGRTFSAQEETGAVPVVVLGQKVRSFLFGGEPAIGKHVTIAGVELEVVGVLADTPDDRVLEASLDSKVLVPWTTFSRLRPHHAGGKESPFSMAWLAVERKALDQTIKRVRGLQTGTKESRNDIVVESVEQTLEEVFRGTKRLLIGFFLVAVAFLIISGISIFGNTLQECLARYQELGIRKAVGASSVALVKENLARVGLIAIVGSLLGISLAWVLGTSVLSGVAGISVVLGRHSRVVAAVSCALASLAASLLPSVQIARVDPAKAISTGAPWGEVGFLRYVGLHRLLCVIGIGLITAFVVVTFGLTGAIRSHARYMTTVFGERTINVVAFRSWHEDFLPPPRLTLEDCAAISKGLPEAANLASAAVESSYVSLFTGSEVLASLVGTDAILPSLARLRPASGRFLSSQEIEKAERVGVIGGTLWHKLGRPALETEVLVGGIGHVRLVGILEPRPEIREALQFNHSLLVPRGVLRSTEEVSFIVVEVAEEHDVDWVANEVRRIIHERHPDKGSPVIMWPASHIRHLVSSVKEIERGAGLFVITAAALALAGILHSVFLSIAAKAREIAVRRAVGAAKRRVAWELFAELVGATLVGWVPGAVVGGVVAETVRSASGWQELAFIPGVAASLWLCVLPALLAGVVLGMVMTASNIIRGMQMGGYE